MGRILEACPGGCGRRNVALCARGVCGKCYGRFPDVAARRGKPASAPQEACAAPPPAKAAPAPRARQAGSVKRLACPRCGRRDLAPNPRTPDRLPSHTRPAGQQRGAAKGEPRLLCRAV